MIRTLGRLCIASIGLGVFSLVVVISVMNGFNNSIRDKLLATEPHLVIYPHAGKAAQIRDDLAQQDVEFHRFESQDVIIRTLDGTFSGAAAHGLEMDSLRALLTRVEENKRSKGRKGNIEPRLAPESLMLDRAEIIMGADLARSLNILEGDQVVVIPPEALLLPPGEAPPFEKVTVKSTLSTDLSDVDSHLIYYTLGKSLTRFSQAASRETGFEVYLINPDSYPPIKARAEKIGARVDTWVDRNSALFFALKLEKIAMTTFLALSALITSFSVLGVLALLITQKRQDIGVLMSMGMSNKLTRQTFLKIGLLLSLVGMGGGWLLGVIASWLIQTFPLNVLPSDVYYDSSIPARLDPVMLVIVVAGCTIVAFLAAWIPVRLHTRVTPSEALKKV